MIFLRGVAAADFEALWKIFLEIICKVGSEPSTPRPYHLVTDVDTSPLQQLLHVPVEEQKAVVKVHRPGDDRL